MVENSSIVPNLKYSSTLSQIEMLALYTKRDYLVAFIIISDFSFDGFTLRKSIEIVLSTARRRYNLRIKPLAKMAASWAWSGIIRGAQLEHY